MGFDMYYSGMKKLVVFIPVVECMHFIGFQRIT